jgi:hypothetical protein
MSNAQWPLGVVSKPFEDIAGNIIIKYNKLKAHKTLKMLKQKNYPNVAISINHIMEIIQILFNVM